MSQLATAPRAQTAKQLQKIKHIKHVESAIRWHERQRRHKRKVADEAREAKKAAIEQVKWHNEHVRNRIWDARRHAREDWKLGPLRPNRAVGDEASRYGALEQDDFRRPDIPIKAQENRNKVQERKGLEIDYPIVVNNERYFPFAKDDRVVVMKGKDKFKIGTVESINETSHEIVIKDLNMHYLDGRIFTFSSDDPDFQSKRIKEVPFPIKDVRLVIPYAYTNVVNSSTIQLQREVQEDVIVDKIHMERHTTGIDPFTGIDYGKDAFPEEHQFDPVTGKAIFHRYIAGTRHRIDWPHERAGKNEDAGKNLAEEESQGGVRSLLTKARHPIDTYKQWKAKKEPVAEADQAEEETDVEERRIPRGLEEQPAETNDGTDTTIDKVEQGQNLVYSISHPPHPPQLFEELRAELFSMKDVDKDALKTVKEAERLALKEAEEQAKQKLIDSMKTPMQLRWELEQAKKPKYDPKNPTPPSESLLAYLGQHMESNGVKLTQKRRKQTNDAELD